ncbi:hypothetical protein DFH07DRAFT_1054984 [Mycena maculata]|uniref:Uncharacterized protein n=1 Tax=Mycena maculata TaxID=230809 RepID=A0AAD7KE98_9AGAR|nr:hypothetical protein DFH07DRAFT_1054984 [Mycena maculata]
MSTKQVSTLSPTPPSPGPALPGAWPSSSHRRSTTSPTPRPVVDPLHLEHVLDFQQRLVSQMDQSELPSIPSTTTFAASVSADNAILPADSLDSQLTRFRTDTSTSMVTDTSVSTTYTSRSSPERFVAGKLPQLPFKTKYSAVESNNYPTRIPRPTNYHIPDQIRQSQRQNIFSTESPSPPRPHASRVRGPDTSASSLSLDCASNGSPMSPIIFASPASSALPRVTSKSQSSPPHNSSSSYEYNSSPSWETSYGSEYNDRHMLDPSPSPSPSPMAGRSNLAARTMSAMNRTPSIEISPAVPMLTSLSLPASPDTSMSLEIDVVSRSPRLSPINGDSSSWSLSLSPASPVLSVVPDLSLLSPAVDGHVVSFPSSSSFPFESPLPSPVFDEASPCEYVGNTSGAEYAAAVMSSAWVSEGPSMAQVIPQGLVLTENETNPVEDEIAPDPDPSVEVQTMGEVELPERLAYESVQSRRRAGKKVGVIEKMKKLGDKVKRLLRGKTRALGENGGVNIDVDVRVGSLGNSPLQDELPDIIDIQSHTATAQAYDRLLPMHGTDSHLPLPLPPPPGLIVRKPKARPILSSQTYSSTLGRTRTRDNTNTQNPPTIRIRPPSSSGVPSASNNVSKTPSPDLTVHSRPKTLAEIKSKRRLSLSTLSNFTRSSSPTPPVNVVTSTRRARPVSALAFYPRPPPLSTLRDAARANNGSGTTHHRLEVSATTSSRTTSTVSGTVRSGSISALTSADNQFSADSIKKKNRRFSLSALSNFAAGHWDEGSWQRNGGLRSSPDQ